MTTNHTATNDSTKHPTTNHDAAGRSAWGRLRRAAIMAAVAAGVIAAAASADAQAVSMLHASGRQIVDASGKSVSLRGVNLGGWFVMESYMSPMDAGSLTDTYSVMAQLDASYGVAEERVLMKAYQDTWIQAQDFANIKAGGFNAVRVPLWWGQFFDLTNPTIPGWRSDAFAELDQLVANAAANGIYVIFDMHGVIGGQGTDPDTGRANVNQFWSNSEYQSDTAWMWWQIANHFKGNATVAGYDLINEPTGAPNTAAVWSAYAKLYTSIRSADPDHMIFIEGTFGNWNWDMLPPPSQYGWTNVVYEMHEYQWNANGNASVIDAGADRQATDFANHASWNVPGYIGEFNAFQGGAAAWQHSVTAYNNAGLSWTSWAYKAVNGVAPNYWGWYDPTYWPARPNVSTDSAPEIQRKWQLWSTSATFAKNTAINLKPSY
ncbi:glycoside hydrolase family 5 protein [Burkholderia plantarii]|uniref:glycoside hydrolase family 5 protein n=1 Tax=Burkholderia plantarii TaxID=41899 RepID=UPI0018DB762F|nr:cellulase family glycosylhydrolase [Burkholderia plantarii]MBI0329045.1 cellulase family glycosylhydrolase [Burkholderia plantarii]